MTDIQRARITTELDICPFPEPEDNDLASEPRTHRFGRRALLMGSAIAWFRRMGLTRSVAAQSETEGRALWVNRFEYSSAADVQHIVAQAARANFNLLYFQVRGAADALYRSSLEPCAVGLCGQLGGTPPYDPLEIAVAEAEKHGIQIHAWLNALSAWPAGSTAVCELLTDTPPDSPQHLLRKHPDWVAVDRFGQPMTCPNDDEYVMFSPAFPGVRMALAQVAADLCQRYGIRGIHLDRLRYPGKNWSYDDVSLAGFGRDPDEHAEAWDQFRRNQIEKTVRETWDAMRDIDPSLTLSAALWPVYKDRWGWNASAGYDWFFQDARAWAEHGFLDVAVPMTYDPIAAQHCDVVDWACLLEDHLDGVQRATGRHVYIGVAARNGPDEVIREIELGRERGVTGFAFYSYSSVDSADLWSRLAKGPFHTPAAIPSQPWKPERMVLGDGTSGPALTDLQATPVPIKRDGE